MSLVFEVFLCFHLCCHIVFPTTITPHLRTTYIHKRRRTWRRWQVGFCRRGMAFPYAVGREDNRRISLRIFWIRDRGQPRRGCYPVSRLGHGLITPEHWKRKFRSATRGAELTIIWEQSNYSCAVDDEESLQYLLAAQEGLRFLKLFWRIVVFCF
jgi:hypothetical protein